MCNALCNALCIFERNKKVIVQVKFRIAKREHQREWPKEYLKSGKEYQQQQKNEN